MTRHLIRLTKSRTIRNLAGLLLFFFYGAAPASVMYEWQTLSTSEQIWSIEGSLTISDEAYNAGYIDYEFQPNACFPWQPGCVLSDADAPIRKLDVSVNGKTVYISPVAGESNNSLNEWLVIAEFETITGILSGLLYGNNMESDFIMTGGPIWNLDRFGSDDESSGCMSQCLDGATGVWRKVPTPSTISLFLLAALGTGFVHYRRNLDKLPRNRRHENGAIL